MIARFRTFFWRALRLMLVLAWACLPAGQVAGAGPAWPSLRLQRVVSGLSAPVSITAADDLSGRTYIVEQTGTIRILQHWTLQAEPFLDVHSLLSCCGERGLLGLAFPPGYAAKGHFYIYYTAVNGSIQIARYNTSANPNLADPASGVVLITIPHPTFGNHNGGQLAFGGDGYLYVGVGDGGSGGDPGNHGQSQNTLLGKLLRLDVEGAGCVQNSPRPSNYCIPADNPFIASGTAMPEIWAWGLRNPWRFSFDRQTHDLYIADVGQDIQEEVDFQPAASLGGENYGWKVLEGTRCYSPSSGCTPPAQYVPPVATYDHGAGDSNGCSVTGGYVYRGPNIYLAMNGVYFYADFCLGKIYGLQNNAGWQTRLLLTAPFAVSTFGEDGYGNLYLADYSGGAIYQLSGEINPAVLIHHQYAPLLRR